MSNTIIVTTKQDLESIVDSAVRRAIAEQTKDPISEKETNSVSAVSDLYSAKEVEKLFNICPATRIAWSKKGVLPAPIKLNNRIYYPKAEIQSAIDNQRKVI